MEIADDNTEAQIMDHHGIVAAVCKDLKIADRINEKLDKNDPRRIVSPGTAAVAMIINGLGFTNRRLYLTHQFFETKPIDRLIGQDVHAKHLDDHTLGKTLDEISEYGCSRLFSEIAFTVAMENKLLGKLAHADTTSISVEGEYKSSEQPGTLSITQGYSKDGRSDLNQLIFSLVTSGPADIPIWSEALDGNRSDKKSLAETIHKVREFQSQLKESPDFLWIADSALYSKDKLLSQNEYFWISRVPETIHEAKKIVSMDDEKIQWIELKNGYRFCKFTSEYGDLKQRWILVFSKKCYEKEKKTFEKNIKKLEEKLEKQLWHLGNKTFTDSKQASQAMIELLKDYPLFKIKYKFTPVKKYQTRGRPKENNKQQITGYKIDQYNIEKNQDEIQRVLNKKGRFILATNDLDEHRLPSKSILIEYKKQQSVERGFRFLKDPWFMADSIFLKSPARISALMMIMTLCLLVYNVAQYRLREALKTQNKTLPNQLKKQVQNPTLRWIFQIMEGVVIIRNHVDRANQKYQDTILNLNDIKIKIITLLGITTRQIYGIP